MVTTLNEYKALVAKRDNCQSVINEARIILESKPDNNLALKTLNYWTGRLRDFNKKISLLGARPYMVRITSIRYNITYYDVEQELAEVLFKEKYPNEKISSIHIE